MNYDILKNYDPELYASMGRELQRQRDHIELIASENFTSQAVMEAMGSHLTNKYAEGYPGARYYGGCEYVDEGEQIAIDRAKKLFGAEYANVQPHSGAQANIAVYAGLLQPGDKILGMDLAHGGHLTHGSKASVSGRYYEAHYYGVSPETEMIDYDDVQRIAEEVKPKLIIAGASAYPRIIDFKRFREIADSVGAYLLVDMAHIGGLVAGGAHPSPVPYADVVTTTTHKTLRGPRGAIILCKEELGKKIDSGVFPRTQGGPLMHIIAAKAVCLKAASEPGRPVPGGEERSDPGRDHPRLRRAAGFRRHGQPSDAAGRLQQGPHRQGDPGTAGQGEHHRQQERDPLRHSAGQPDQRRPSGHPGLHRPRHEGRADAPHRRLHLPSDRCR